MSSPAAANPVRQYRAPVGLKREDIDRGYFTTRRQDVINDTGALNVYPGAFRYLPDSTLEVDFAIWEDLPTAQSRAMLFSMQTREGYNVVMADEWEIVDDLYKMAWKRDSGGRLTFSGADTNALVLMWRTGEEADRADEAKRGMLRQVSRSAEEAQSQYQEKLGPLGADIRVTIDEESPEETEIKRSPKRGRR